MVQNSRVNDKKPPTSVTHTQLSHLSVSSIPFQIFYEHTSKYMYYFLLRNSIVATLKSILILFCLYSHSQLYSNPIDVLFLVFFLRLVQIYYYRLIRIALYKHQFTYVQINRINSDKQNFGGKGFRTFINLKNIAKLHSIEMSQFALPN